MRTHKTGDTFPRPPGCSMGIVPTSNSPQRGAQQATHSCDHSCDSCELVRTCQANVVLNRISRERRRLTDVVARALGATGGSGTSHAYHNLCDQICTLVRLVVRNMHWEDKVRSRMSLRRTDRNHQARHCSHRQRQSIGMDFRPCPSNELIQKTTGARQVVT